MTANHFFCEAFALIGLPSWIIDENCVVSARNAPAQRSVNCVSGREGEQIFISDAAAAKLLREAMADRDDRSLRSIPVKDRSGNPTNILHLHPLADGAHEALSGYNAIVIVTSIAPLSAPAALLQLLYGLTPAETLVAHSLSMGRSINHISSRSGASPNTVRTHLRRVLEKTGCSRQAEAVALFAGISLLPAIYATHALPARGE